MQRHYISALLETLDNLVEFWAPQDEKGPKKGGAKKALIYPTRESQDIGRLNATNIINLEGIVTRVRAIQVCVCLINFNPKKSLTPSKN